MRIPSFTAPGKKGSNNAESDNRYVFVHKILGKF